MKFAWANQSEYIVSLAGMSQNNDVWTVVSLEFEQMSGKHVTLQIVVSSERWF